MLEEPIREGVPPKMKGSVLMCVADTEEEVLERVRRDVYYERGVWDKEKVGFLFSFPSLLGLEILDLGGILLLGCFELTDGFYMCRFRSSRSRALLGRDSRGVNSYCCADTNQTSTSSNLAL